MNTISTVTPAVAATVGKSTRMRPRRGLLVLILLLAMVLPAREGLGQPREFHELEQYKPGVSPERLIEVQLLLPSSETPQQVVVALKDGLLIWEGDIILGRADSLLGPIGAGKAAAAVITTGGNLWPNATIPFQIDANVPNQARITNAIAQIEAATNLQFVQRTVFNAFLFPDFVRVQRATGCFSFIGRTGGQQILGLADGCSTGSTIHEFLHAAGVFHEQSRYDRDDYVVINWANITSGMEGNFQKCSNCNSVGPYDFGSIMHYGAFAFSSNGQPTITSLVPGVTMGQRNGMSAGDMQGIDCLYGGGRCYPGLWVGNYGYNAGGWRVEYHPRFLADVNGDGRDDVVGFGNAGTYVSLSTGSTFTLPWMWSYTFGYNAGGWRVERHPRFLADVNGDGEADVVGFGNAGAYVLVNMLANAALPQAIAEGGSDTEDQTYKPGDQQQDTGEVPDAISLEQNYPNPFNPETEIAFTLSLPARVRLTVYDLLGREVIRLVDGDLGAGSHAVRFEGGHLPSGTYLYRLEARGDGRSFTQTRRMVLVK